MLIRSSSSHGHPVGYRRVLSADCFGLILVLSVSKGALLFSSPDFTPHFDKGDDRCSITWAVMRLGIVRVLYVLLIVIILFAALSVQDKFLKIAAAAALLRGGPMIPLPIRFKVPQQTKVRWPMEVKVELLT